MYKIYSRLRRMAQDLLLPSPTTCDPTAGFTGAEWADLPPYHPPAEAETRGAAMVRIARSRSGGPAGA